MSDFDDHPGEMSRHRLITDDDAETILSGVAGDPDFDELVEFVGELRRTALDHEIGPSVFEMAMSAGFSNEKGDLSATAASNVTGPALQVAGLPKRRTRMPIPAFIAGLTLAGKLTIGASLVAAAGTGAAATGSLPGPAQDAVAAAVRTVSPIELPRSGDDTVNDDVELLATTTDDDPVDVNLAGDDPVDVDPAGDDPIVVDPAGDDPAETDTDRPESLDGEADGPDDATFGALVSAAATGADGSEPGVDGSVISEMARQLRFQNPCQRSEDGDDENTDETETVTLETVDVVADDEGTDEQRPNCRPERAGPPESAGPPEVAGRPDTAGPPVSVVRPEAPARPETGPPATTGRPDVAVPTAGDPDAATASTTGRSAPRSAPGTAPGSTPGSAPVPPAAPVPAATEVAPSAVPAQDPPPQSPPVADPPARGRP